MSHRLPDQERRAWRKFWLTSLHQFTSLEEQEALWLAQRPGQMGSFVECMCGYFDDALHGKSLERFCDLGFLSQAEVDASREFHRLADTYHPPTGNNSDHRSILRDPKWHSVVLAAQQAWAVLRSNAESAEELDLMAVLDAD